MALDAMSNMCACTIARHCVQRITPSGVISAFSKGAHGNLLKPPTTPHSTPLKIFTWPNQESGDMIAKG